MISDPSTCATLTSLLELRARISPSHAAFSTEGKNYSFLWLWESVKRFGSILASRNVAKNDRVLVMVPNSAEFFVAFYGCILCGAVPVPVFSGAGTSRCSQLASLCGSTNIIIPEKIESGRKTSFAGWSTAENIKIHLISENLAPVQLQVLPAADPDDIAFIQYTSGSTEFPRGVPLSHNNLLTNIMQMVEAMSITENDVFVSWLPVYHDMGLILNTMVPFYTRAKLFLMAEGLHRVHSWLKAIEKNRGTFISAPDVAYRLCVQSVHQPGDYDLSSLRIALNASEPVHYQTYHLFEETFGLKNVMISGYGLAEATLAVTIHPPGQPPRIDERGYVSSGRPVRGIELKTELPKKDSEAGIAGEILLKSPAMMKGYYKQSNTLKSFDRNGYLRTGDVGYLDHDGYLYVLGRKKNVILHAGHTIFPDDMEQVVRTIDSVRHAAAIGIEETPLIGETLYIFAETKWGKIANPDEYHTMAITIVQEIYRHFGLRPGCVYLLKPKTLPFTPNGKLQHAILKNLYVNNFLELEKKILYPKLSKC